jgi:hypothetical protein
VPVGQWTVQQHLNYAFAAPKEPLFPGGFAPDHALNGTPEFAYGVNKWFELDWYIPFAGSDDRFLSNGVKLEPSSLFPMPLLNQVCPLGDDR